MLPSERRRKRIDRGRAVCLHTRAARGPVTVARFHMRRLACLTVTVRRAPLEALETRLAAVEQELDAIEREVAALTAVARGRKAGRR